jgi:hypothetical protein
MDLRVIILYYACSVAGLAMVVGGIWLIYKQKIYIDRETKQVIEVETLFGTFRTNIPALALFIIGFIPLIYPIYQITDLTKKVRISGMVRSSSHPVLVYATIGIDSLAHDREFSLYVPQHFGPNEDYKILFFAGNIQDEAIVNPRTAKGDEIKLIERQLNIPLHTIYGPVEPLQPTPEKFARR